MKISYYHMFPQEIAPSHVNSVVLYIKLGPRWINHDCIQIESNMGRRITLIWSTLSSMPIYFMPLLRLPMVVRLSWSGFKGTSFGVVGFLCPFLLYRLGCLPGIPPIYSGVVVLAPIFFFL